jgi:hypothetical protein
MAPQNKGAEKLKKTNYLTLQRPVPEHPKNSFYIALLLLEFNDGWFVELNMALL